MASNWRGRTSTAGRTPRKKTIGDNRASREGVGIWIAGEPDPAAPRPADAVFLRIHYPDGPRDAEALVVLDDGGIVIVSKGRENPISVYRSAPLEWPVAGAQPVGAGTWDRASRTPTPGMPSSVATAVQWNTDWRVFEQIRRMSTLGRDSAPAGAPES